MVSAVMLPIVPVPLLVEVTLNVSSAPSSAVWLAAEFPPRRRGTAAAGTPNVEFTCTTSRRSRSHKCADAPASKLMLTQRQPQIRHAAVAHPERRIQQAEILGSRLSIGKRKCRRQPSHLAPEASTSTPEPASSRSALPATSAKSPRSCRHSYPALLLRTCGSQRSDSHS